VSLEVLLLQVAIAFGLCVWIACARNETPTARGSLVKGLGAALGVHLAAACAVTMITGNRLTACAGVAAGVLTFLALLKSLRRFTMVGRLLLSTHLELMVVGTAWGVSYVLSLHVSTETHALMLGGLPLMAVTIPLGLLGMIPQWDVLCRYEWRRPRAPLQHSSRGGYPRVSLHVPICSEPPDVVIATLEALARMESPNFEVLVIDNNTHNEWLAGVAGLCTGARGLRLCLFLGVLLQGVGYLTAPFVALLAEWDLWRATIRQFEDTVEEAEAAA
jgi:hypothetical protein